MDFMMTEMWMGKPIVAWVGFLAVIGVLLVFDLGVLHRKQHTVDIRESVLTTLSYMGLAGLFGLWIAHEYGGEKALQYVTGYVVEMSLSMDNVFVMALILGYFAIPRIYQHRVLFWGVMGVIVLRGAMIISGAALIQKFEWILYVFAGFLIISGVKMLWMSDEKPDLAKNPVLRFLKSYGRVTNEIHGERFLVRLKDGNTGRLAWYMTPLFVALILVELADVVFAVDSVPAIFAITTDPYIVMTSNVFAILGLRSLYFALSAMMERFEYIDTALAALLIFIGGKMLGELMHLFEISNGVSLAITFAILAIGTTYSLWKTKEK